MDVLSFKQFGKIVVLSLNKFVVFYISNIKVKLKTNEVWQTQLS